MFKELAPMVANGTSLCIMVTAASEGNLTVTVLPQGKDANSALNTPLSVTAPPEELDAELPAALIGYTGTRTTLAETLENVKTIMEAAGKTAREAATNAAAKKTAATAPAGTEDDEDPEDENESATTPARTVSKAPAAAGKTEIALSLF